MFNQKSFGTEPVVLHVLARPNRAERSAQDYFKAVCGTAWVAGQFNSCVGFCPNAGDYAKSGPLGQTTQLNSEMLH